MKSYDINVFAAGFCAAFAVVGAVEGAAGFTLVSCCFCAVNVVCVAVGRRAPQ